MQFDEFKQKIDQDVTPAGMMAVALTINRNRNARVQGGTAAPSPIYGGLDPAEVARRRRKDKAARKARAAHRKGGK